MLINYNKYFKKATINKIIIAKFKIFFLKVYGLKFHILKSIKTKFNQLTYNLIHANSHIKRHFINFEIKAFFFLLFRI